MPTTPRFKIDQNPQWCTLIHSTVDYPLRTVAMTSLFAFACAFLVPAPPSSVPRPKKSDQRMNQMHTDMSVEAARLRA